MFVRYLLFGLLLAATAAANAAERYVLKIELTQGEKLIERGKSIVTLESLHLKQGS